MYTVEKANCFIADNQDKVDSTYFQKIHLMPPIGWMNDPNGFIQVGDELHLFYQFYPYDSIWGPMHWGHAKTTDGFYWQHLPVALAPDQEYEVQGCFSGTALLKDSELILMYTGGTYENDTPIQQQCVATSSDFVHFKKNEKNPIISQKDLPDFISAIDFRDPKIIYRENKYFALIVSKTKNNHGSIVLFESDNLDDWEFKSVILAGDDSLGEMWECPDLIEIDGYDILVLSAINMPNQKNQFTNISSCLYFVGKIDWETGSYSYERYAEIDGGLDFYAPQMTKTTDGQRLLVAWMQMWDRTIPTHDLRHKWAGCMTLIRKLKLKNQQLIQEPLLPIDILRIQLADDQEMLLSQNQIPCVIEIPVKGSGDFIWRYTNDQEELIFKKEAAVFTLDRRKLGYQIKGKEIDYQNYREILYEAKTDFNIEIVLDTSSIEVFLDDGHKSMSMRYFSRDELTKMEFVTQ